jgi:hypothetical protein
MYCVQPVGLIFLFYHFTLIAALPNIQSSRELIGNSGELIGNVLEQVGDMYRNLWEHVRELSERDEYS